MEGGVEVRHRHFVLVVTLVRVMAVFWGVARRLLGWPDGLGRAARSPRWRSGWLLQRLMERNDTNLNLVLASLHNYVNKHICSSLS